MGDYLSKIRECRFVRELGISLKPADGSVVAGIGDDAAVIKGKGGNYWLFTVDMLIESVHFKAGEDLKKVGYKALAVSVSDIAAMGGLPKYALVSAGFPSKNFEKISRELLEGIKRCASVYNISIIGGDTVRSDRLVVDIFLAGEVEKKRLVMRSGGRNGDALFVSGKLGGSIKGRHLSFEPRIRQSRYLTSRFNVHAMMDLSDGLAMDLSRLAEASGLGAVIFEKKVPVHPDARGFEAALTDGEDYELLFALSKKDASKLMRSAKGFSFFQVGVLTDEFKGVKIADIKGRLKPLPGPSFKHF